jgi:hypothetical protein
VGAVILFSFIYFYEGGGWNQNSRFDLLRAIVERHTLQIDAYHENTQDKAHYNGHYYSDKAPGLVFLAVPVAVVARPVLRMVGVDPESARGEVALSYLVSAFVVALPTALAAVVLFLLGLRFGASFGGAAFGAIVMALGTPIWAYASLFWAHALVGACLIFAFAAALKVGESAEGRSDFLWAFAVGMAAGWATVTEYPAAPASAVLAILAITRVWRRGKAARWRVIGGVVLGAGLCLIVLVSYLYVAFGSLRPSYSYYDPNSFSFMQKQGYLGLTYPHPDRLLKLLFGCSRGLFFASPVLVAAVAGLWWMRKGPWRAAVLAASAIVAYYFLFNASFYWWKAGLTFGPRYAGAAIPLLCLGLAFSWERASLAWRRVLIVLAVFSVGVALMTVSTSSQLSMQDSCPIVHSVWPNFWTGKIAMNRESMLTVDEANGKYGAFNLGQLVGLSGLSSLIPLIAIWGCAAVLWMRVRRAG